MVRQIIGTEDGISNFRTASGPLDVFQWMDLISTTLDFIPIGRE